MEKSEFISIRPDFFIADFQEVSCRQIALKQGDVCRLFDVGFGENYINLLEEMLGHAFHVVRISPQNKPDELVAIFPFTAEKEIREKWAEKIKKNSPEWSELVCISPDLVLMDFCTISPKWKGKIVPCFKSAAKLLFAKGIHIGITEAQWLKQILLWKMIGWKELANPAIDIKTFYKEVVSGIKRSATTDPVLSNGNKFMWHTGQIYNKPTWNVLIESPLFLSYQLKSAVHNV